VRNFVKEFKDFIATGNMMELAVAVILAGAVGAVIAAFTNGIMMQIVAAIIGKPDFSDVTITLREDVDGEGNDSVLQVGAFVNTLITLLLTGLVLFVIVKAYNRMSKQPQDVIDEAPTELGLLSEIRDLLQQQQRPG
jgi:large conductance mechanosensitive channel